MKLKAAISNLPSQETLQKELELLYLRKSAVVDLIRSLEQYDRFRTRPELNKKKIA
jgi:hypothetical protein